MCILSADAGLEALSESKRYAARLHPHPLLLITLIPISHKSPCACRGFRPVPPPSYPYYTLSCHRQSTCLRHPDRGPSLSASTHLPPDDRPQFACWAAETQIYESRVRYRCRFGRCGAVDERLCAFAPEARAQDARAATATCAALLRRLEIFQGYMRILASIRVRTQQCTCAPAAVATRHVDARAARELGRAGMVEV
ncbi:hypothetical protein B0H13DRAFT_2050380 [Mycena leptocephala]|nr:hypothetical protein B0H13DRAFT_2050380 [Mycena leptocephala]